MVICEIMIKKIHVRFMNKNMDKPDQGGMKFAGSINFLDKMNYAGDL